MPKPGPKCKACSHPQRAHIDAWILDPAKSYPAISNEFGLSQQVLKRHAKNPDCSVKSIVDKIRNLDEWADLEETLNTARQLKAINTVAWETLKKARDKGNPQLVLQAVDRVLAQIKHQDEKLGEIDRSPTVNILIAPIVREVIVDALIL